VIILGFLRVARFEPAVKPDDKKAIAVIEAELKKK
jgi:hypothetical protein